MAEQMWIRGENGMLNVFDLPLPPGIRSRLDRGDLTRVTKDGAPWVDPGEEVLEPPVEDGIPADAPPLPKKTENRAVWTEFAVSQGMDREQAASMTKAELIDTFAQHDA